MMSFEMHVDVDPCRGGNVLPHSLNGLFPHSTPFNRGDLTWLPDRLLQRLTMRPCKASPGARDPFGTHNCSLRTMERSRGLKQPEWTTVTFLARCGISYLGCTLIAAPPLGTSLAGEYNEHVGALRLRLGLSRKSTAPYSTMMRKLGPVAVPSVCNDTIYKVHCNTMLYVLLYYTQAQQRGLYPE